MAVRIASYNAAHHFGLRRVGAICPGYHAALAVLEDLEDCRVTRVYQGGQLVARDGECLYAPPRERRQPIVRSTINVHRAESTCPGSSSIIFAFPVMARPRPGPT